MQPSPLTRTIIPIALAGILLLLAAAAVVARPGLSAGLPAQTTPAVTPTVSKADAGGAYIVINPAAGFPLDPFLVSLQAGGTVTATTLTEGCTGYVSANPAVTVDYKGSADLLRAFFYSDGDTTLVVETPDGDILCNDNTSQLVLDPTIEITQPVKGPYSVWVGSASAKDLVPGFLVLTTHHDVTAGTMALASLVKRPAAPAVLPHRERLTNAARRIAEATTKLTAVDTLRAGGKDITKDFTADGDLPAPELQTGDTLCGGLVHETPDYAFDWSGETPALNLLVEANADTTLMVRAPDGSYLCADDTDGTRNLNPLLTIRQPAAGQYLVWIGRVDPSKAVTGNLLLTEAASAKPKVLPKQ